MSLQNWIEKNMDIADIGTVMPLVRLHLMSCDQLLNIVRPSGLVQSDRLLEAIEMLNTNKMSRKSVSKYAVLLTLD